METDFCGRPLAIYPVTCAYCAMGNGVLGNFEKSKIVAEKGLKVAETVQDQFTLALTEFNCGLAYLLHGDGQPAFDHFQIALKCADEVKQTVLSMFATCYLGASYLLMGEYEWVCLLGFSASALKCKVRDQWIGWSYRHQLIV